MARSSLRTSARDDLKHLLLTGAVRLVKNSWLKQQGDKAWTRRQDMPEEAFATAEEALSEISTFFAVAVISHAWLQEGHPDPRRDRRADMKWVYEKSEIKYVFLDFMSLHQWPRTEAEYQLFREALSRMHLVYSNPHWLVYRFSTVPSDAPNPVPYGARGWCFFETAVSSVGAMASITVQNGSIDPSCVSPVPMKPAAFAEQVGNMHFTSKRVDLAVVIELYEKIWPTIKAKDTTLFVYSWGDEEMQEFLKVLPEMAKLREVVYADCRISAAMMTMLQEAMNERGGIVRVMNS